MFVRPTMYINKDKKGRTWCLKSFTVTSRNQYMEVFSQKRNCIVCIQSSNGKESVPTSADQNTLDAMARYYLYKGAPVQLMYVKSMIIRLFLPALQVLRLKFFLPIPVVNRQICLPPFPY